MLRGSSPSAGAGHPDSTAQLDQSARILRRPGSTTEKRPSQSVRDCTMRASVIPASAARGIGMRNRTTPKPRVGRLRQTSSPKSLSKVSITAPASRARLTTSSSAAPRAISRTKSTCAPACRRVSTARAGKFSSARNRITPQADKFSPTPTDRAHTRDKREYHRFRAWDNSRECPPRSNPRRASRQQTRPTSACRAPLVFPKALGDRERFVEFRSSGPSRDSYRIERHYAPSAVSRQSPRDRSIGGKTSCGARPIS